MQNGGDAMMTGMNHGRIPFSSLKFALMGTLVTLVANAATTWYVNAGSGNDGNSGKTQSAAKKTIQAAIDKASAGDTIIVSEGSYAPISSTKKLTIKSANGALNTLIVGSSGKRCATLSSGNSANVSTVLNGFTIYGGKDVEYGGGVLGGVLQKCIIHSNSAKKGGGAAYSTLQGCTIRNNTATANYAGSSGDNWGEPHVTTGAATAHGGGAYQCQVKSSLVYGNTATAKSTSTSTSYNTYPIVAYAEALGAGLYGGDASNTVISNNTASAKVSYSTSSFYDQQGGYWAYHSSKAAGSGIYGDRKSTTTNTFVNCLIVKNKAGASGGSDNRNSVYGAGVYESALKNCTVADNSISSGKTYGAGTYKTWACNTISYNNSNQDLERHTCLTSNPNFVNASKGDYHLSANSSAINAGWNGWVPNGITTDLDGEERIHDGTVDQGCYEYIPTPMPQLSGTTARQRYPWNGKVDICFSLAEANNRPSIVSISAKDLIGNTNLPMRTVSKANGQEVNVSGETLQSGSYHFVWDAMRDLPSDSVIDRVAVEIEAEKSATSTSENFNINLLDMGPWKMHSAEMSETIQYSTTWATNVPSGANAVVKVWPAKRVKPKYVAIDLSGGPSVARYPLEFFDEIPGGAWSDEYKTTKLVLRHIPAGSFIMGGRATDYPGAVNTNLHQVTLTKDFYMGVFEVTQRQYELVMGNRPSAFSNETCYAMRPVEKICYADIRGSVKGITWPKSKEVDDGSFLGLLRKKTGLSYFDLPTEAQWEYTCRAGTLTALNSGNDVLYLTEIDEGLNEVARYDCNSGRRIGPQQYTANDYSYDASLGTALVGTYAPNDFGLYNMHGNVWEMVLDWAKDVSQNVDAVGAENGTKVVCKGGGWSTRAERCISAAWSSDSSDFSSDNRGFRLCLQGGVLPELDSGTVLVNEQGEGEATWTPAKVGVYYLTHEIQTNGVNGAGLLGAWFEVPGSTAVQNLTILAEGDLVEGVAIRLGGVPEGWTLHYTTDGSEPTAASPAYTGPFALAQSATVKAVAVNNEAGWATDVAEQRFDLAPPLALTGANMRQRYPWNGLVDIDFTLSGDTSKFYRVTAEATDRGGGTNLSVRTVWEVGGGVTNSVLDVTPGTHRFVWDAAADLPAGFVADRVAVSLRAEALHGTALYMVIDLSGGPDAAHYPVSHLPDVPEGGWTDEYKTDKLVLRRVEPGTFTMGSPDWELIKSSTAIPHVVTLTKPFYAGVFETTQRQWELVKGDRPSYFVNEACYMARPVETIHWAAIRGNDVGNGWPDNADVDEDSFIAVFRAKTGDNGFDLPTEAQWEYACRAGTTSSFNNGKNVTNLENDPNANIVGRNLQNGGDEGVRVIETDIGTCNADDSVGTAKVGCYLPNAWGLFDMHGNVTEQCLDWWLSFTAEPAVDPVGPRDGEQTVFAFGTQRIARGCGIHHDGAVTHSSIRQGYPVGGNDPKGDDGFRLFLHDAPAVVEAPIVAPQNLAATSDRTDDVSLSWQPVSGAYAYQIRRSKTTDFADGTWLNTVTNTIYADWTAVLGTNYTYWVRAQFESGKVGRWSEASGGKRAQ